MDLEQKQMVLRYAELIFRRERKSESDQCLTAEELAEIELIKQRLNLLHEKIMELAAQNLDEQ